MRKIDFYILEGAFENKWLCMLHGRKLSDIRHSAEAYRGKNYSKYGNVEKHFQNRKWKEFQKDLNQVTTSQEIKSNPNAQNLGDRTPSLFAKNNDY